MSGMPERIEPRDIHLRVEDSGRPDFPTQYRVTAGPMSTLAYFVRRDDADLFVAARSDPTVSAFRAECDKARDQMIKAMRSMEAAMDRSDALRAELEAERIFRTTAVARLVGYVQGISSDFAILRGDEQAFIRRIRAGLAAEIAEFERARAILDGRK